MSASSCSLLWMSQEQERDYSMADFEKAQARYRKGFTRLLRDASHQLGRFEAQGERQWRKATNQARRDAVKVLKRLEKALEPPARKKKARKRKATVRRESQGSGI